MKNTIFACLLFVAACVNTPTNDPQTQKNAEAGVEVKDKPNKLDDATFDFVSQADTADDCSGDFTPPAVKPGETILLVGDSLGVGLSTEFLKTAKAAGYKPVTHVVSGTTTKFWLKTIAKDMMAHRPSLVVVSLGTNDALSRDHNEKVYEDFSVFVNDNGAFIAWIGLPAISKTKIPAIESTRSKIKSSVPNYFDSEMLELPLGDGIHSTGLGYSKWMKAVWVWMSDLGIVAGSK